MTVIKQFEYFEFPGCNSCEQMSVDYQCEESEQVDWNAWAKRNTNLRRDVGYSMYSLRHGDTGVIDHIFFSKIDICQRHNEIEFNRLIPTLQHGLKGLV